MVVLIVTVGSVIYQSGAYVLLFNCWLLILTSPCFKLPNRLLDWKPTLRFLWSREVIWLFNSFLVSFKSHNLAISHSILSTILLFVYLRVVILDVLLRLIVIEVIANEIPIDKISICGLRFLETTLALTIDIFICYLIFVARVIASSWLEMFLICFHFPTHTTKCTTSRKDLLGFCLARGHEKSTRCTCPFWIFEGWWSRLKA